MREWKKYLQPEDIWADAIEYISVVEDMGTVPEAAMRAWFDANQPLPDSTPLQRENTYLMYNQFLRELRLAKFSQGTITWEYSNG